MFIGNLDGVVIGSYFNEKSDIEKLFDIKKINWHIVLSEDMLINDNDGFKLEEAEWENTNKYLVKFVYYNNIECMCCKKECFHDIVFECESEEEAKNTLIDWFERTKPEIFKQNKTYLKIISVELI